ncbi:hypothetical protein QRX50_29595 [Amycolatopsis carbonis]|uniref:Uncharacterized protein n=1 Tax=Amycolatopsis carbonis TaxID=715471 RepID=A0A9Y2I990_9PSEU|nr:hypothetical protein [Amycolatopsis sp. 2-15]WIX75644.1 hypothetical protein QRX50_29595 [Amycolatopsis sp. 2-15]
MFDRNEHFLSGERTPATEPGVDRGVAAGSKSATPTTSPRRIGEIEASYEFAVENETQTAK